MLTVSRFKKLYRNNTGYVCGDMSWKLDAMDAASGRPAIGDIGVCCALVRFANATKASPSVLSASF